MDKEASLSQTADDSDDEVFFTASKAAKLNNVATSTPLDKTNGRKRKRIPSGKLSPRKTRQRTKMGGHPSTSSSMGEDDAGIDSNAILADLARQMAKINKKMDGMKNTIKSTVAEAVAPLTAKIDANAARMDRFEARQATDLEKIQSSVMQQVNDAMDRRLENGGQGYADGKVPGEPMYASAASATRAGSSSSMMPSPTQMPQNTDWFWNARRCLRIFPIDGKEETEIKGAIYNAETQDSHWDSYRRRLQICSESKGLEKDEEPGRDYCRLCHSKSEGSHAILCQKPGPMDRRQRQTNCRHSHGKTRKAHRRL